MHTLLSSGFLRRPDTCIDTVPNDSTIIIIVMHYQREIFVQIIIYFFSGKLFVAFYIFNECGRAASADDQKHTRL